MSIGLCTFDCWFEHQSQLVQCQQNDKLSETTLWKMNVDPETERNPPETKPDACPLCLCFSNASSVISEPSLSSPGNWDGVWKSESQTPTSEQEGLKVSERVCVCMYENEREKKMCVNWMSLIHSHRSSKPHSAALLSFRKHDLVTALCQQFQGEEPSCRQYRYLEKRGHGWRKGTQLLQLDSTFNFFILGTTLQKYLA